MGIFAEITSIGIFTMVTATSMGIFTVVTATSVGIFKMVTVTITGFIYNGNSYKCDGGIFTQGRVTLMILPREDAVIPTSLRCVMMCSPPCKPPHPHPLPSPYELPPPRRRKPRPSPPRLHPPRSSVLLIWRHQWRTKSQLKKNGM